MVNYPPVNLESPSLWKGTTAAVVAGVGASSCLPLSCLSHVLFPLLLEWGVSASQLLPFPYNLTWSDLDCFFFFWKRKKKVQIEGADMIWVTWMSCLWQRNAIALLVSYLLSERGKLLILGEVKADKAYHSPFSSPSFCNTLHLSPLILIYQYSFFLFFPITVLEIRPDSLQSQLEEVKILFPWFSGGKQMGGVAFQLSPFQLLPEWSLLAVTALNHRKCVRIFFFNPLE